MTGTIGQLFEPGALAIVASGTVLATAARCGWKDLWCGAKALTGAGKTPFDDNENRVAMARTASAIADKGVLCADVPRPPDPSLARMIDAYLRHGSLEDLHAIRRADRAAREIERGRAVRVFEFAGELAPVFGLVGTLFAITQLVPDADGNAVSTLSAIATAVLSTMYGVLLAHLVCIPIASRIERAGLREEEAREQLADWIVRHLREDELEPPVRLRGVA